MSAKNYFLQISSENSFNCKFFLKKHRISILKPKKPSFSFIITFHSHKHCLIKWYKHFISKSHFFLNLKSSFKVTLHFNLIIFQRLHQAICFEFGLYNLSAQRKSRIPLFLQLPKQLHALCHSFECNSHNKASNKDVSKLVLQ